MSNWDQIIDKLDYAFQPIIHSFTGKIYGVEALIRNVQNISGLNAIDDLFNMAFNDDYLYELDLQLREKAIKKFSHIKIDDLKRAYDVKYVEDVLSHDKLYKQYPEAKDIRLKLVSNEN